MEVLIADDDFVSSSLVQKVLESSGHKTLIAENGLKAWELVQRNNIKMVITDWIMPQMDGLTLCRKIRKAKADGYVYVILLTSKNRQSSVEGLEAGADDYIVKPFNSEELIARIRTGERIIRLEEEQKRTHIRLIQTEKEASIGQLAAGVAHEINNPATFVNVNAVTMEKWWKLFEPLFNRAIESGWDQELGLKKLSDMVARFPAMIESIKEGAARISLITNALRSYARPNHGKKELVDVKKVCENAVTMTRNRFKHHAHLVVEIGPDLPEIFGNSQKLEQVFVNLLINAADATKEKTDMMTKQAQPFRGLISITAAVRKLPEKRIEIAVKDNGVGMETKVVRRVFDPFFTTKPQDKGTGLGMSIALGIVQDHGGSILVESTKGEGTAFTITLPVEEASQGKKQEVGNAD